MLNNHINYIFIDIIIIHHYIQCKHYLKRQKISKRDTLLRCFLFGSNWHFLYIRVEKLGLLGFYFSYRSNWAFCQRRLQETKAVWDHIRSYDLTDRKDPWKIWIVLGRWDHKVVESRSGFWQPWMWQIHLSAFASSPQILTLQDCFKYFPFSWCQLNNCYNPFSCWTLALNIYGILAVAIDHLKLRSESKVLASDQMCKQLVSGVDEGFAV